MLKQSIDTFGTDSATIQHELQNIKEDDSFEKFDNLIAPFINDTDEGPVVRGTQLKYSIFGNADPRDIKVKLKKEKARKSQW